MIESQFEDELIPDGLEERLSATSLYNLEHREATSRVYLEFIRGELSPCAAQNNARSIRELVASYRRRADEIDWRPDGDVVLRVGQRETAELVPDATVSSHRRPVRLFLEIDRSKKSLPRIEKNITAYRTLLVGPYYSIFTDRKRPAIVYVVGSKGRQRSIERIARQVLGSQVRWAVLRTGDTTEWLDAELLGTGTVQLSKKTTESSTAAERLSLEHAAQDVLQWTDDFLGELARHGVLERLRTDHAELLSRGRSSLLVLKTAVEHGKEGEPHGKRE